MSTPCGLFNAKIWFLCKCSVIIIKERERERNGREEEIEKRKERERFSFDLVYFFNVTSTPYGLFNVEI